MPFPTYTLDRERGISKRDREYLLGELDVEPGTQRDRRLRMKLRQRAWSTLLDVQLLEEYMEDRDFRTVFGVGDEDDPDVRTQRAVALASLLRVVLRAYDPDRIGGLESLLENALKMEYAEHDRSNEWVRLGSPRVSITVDRAREVNLRDLREKVREIGPEENVEDVLTADEHHALLSVVVEEDKLPRRNSSYEAALSRRLDRDTDPDVHDLTEYSEDDLRDDDRGGAGYGGALGPAIRGEPPEDEDDEDSEE